MLFILTAASFDDLSHESHPCPRYLLIHFSFCVIAPHNSLLRLGKSNCPGNEEPALKGQKISRKQKKFKQVSVSTAKERERMSNAEVVAAAATVTVAVAAFLRAALKTGK